VSGRLSGRCEHGVLIFGPDECSLCTGVRHLPPEPVEPPTQPPPKPADALRAVHAHSAARLDGDEQARIWARELIESEERWSSHKPDGSVVVNAEIARWALRLDAELTIREQSQIPVIPRAAQEQLERAVAEAATLREALEAYERWGNRMPDAGFNINDPRWNWWHTRPYKLARAALVAGREPT
jgi:hypothetical protein